MNILIPWSGGLDSTYLVWKRLQERHVVQPYYVEILNNEQKTVRELNAIKGLRETLKGSLGILLDLQVVKFKSSWTDLESPQLPIIHLGAMYVKNYESDRMEVAYVKGDNCLDHLESGREIIRAMCKMSSMDTKRNTFEVHYPLTDTSKEDIIAELPFNLYKLVTFCEMNYSKPCPYFDGCGQCSPCKRHLETFGVSDVVLEKVH
jgi:7-cyano-7-deazaguanine synthase in queuosine biosynthesis